jgi:hypothetical protein
MQGTSPRVESAGLRSAESWRRGRAAVTGGARGEGCCGAPPGLWVARVDARRHCEAGRGVSWIRRATAARKPGGGGAYRRRGGSAPSEGEAGRCARVAGGARSGRGAGRVAALDKGKSRGSRARLGKGIPGGFAGDLGEPSRGDDDPARRARRVSETGKGIAGECGVAAAVADVRARGAAGEGDARARCAGRAWGGAGGWGQA